MKKYAALVSVVFVALCAVAANAQWVKGSSYAGLRVGIGPYNNAFLVGADYEMAMTKGNDSYGPGSIGVGASVDYTSYSPKSTDQSLTITDSYVFLSIYGAYHFSPSMEDKRLDPYLMVGLAPYAYTDTREALGLSTSSTLYKVAFIGGIGMRYFFNPQWSAHLRLGFGASFVSAGATMTL